MIKTPLSTVIGGAFWTPSATIIGSSSKTLTQLIKSIFATGEQGFAYDPNDLSTLYQDAAGTIPVTAAEQPVGLMLDKSKGLVLGEERLLNSSFETSDNWALDAGSNLSIMNGQAVFSSTPAYKAFRQTGRLTVGKWYKITIDIAEISLGLLYLPNLVDTVIATAGVKTYIAQAKFDYVFLMTSGAGSTAKVNSISVKELAGNHAYQTTSSMRPLLQNSPRKIDYDGVDDKLITNLPAQLTGCTVVRSVPNAGTQILTNQTIPTTYNDNINNCGLIVINRALTASETSQITKLFNKAAGV